MLGISIEIGPVLHSQKPHGFSWAWPYDQSPLAIRLLTSLIMGMVNGSLQDLGHPMVIVIGPRLMRLLSVPRSWNVDHEQGQLSNCYGVLC